MSIEMIWRTVSEDSEKTEELGQILGQIANPPMTICLESDLGGGKTTFTKGLAKGLGILEPVSSPTFTIKKDYSSKDSKVKLFHYDFYRLDDPGIMTEELYESISNKTAFTVIEWPKIVSSVVPKNSLIISLEHTSSNPDERIITFHYPENFTILIERLRQNL